MNAPLLPDWQSNSTTVRLTVGAAPLVQGKGALLGAAQRAAGGGGESLLLCCVPGVLDHSLLMRQLQSACRLPQALPRCA